MFLQLLTCSKVDKMRKFFFITLVVLIYFYKSSCNIKVIVQVQKLLDYSRNVNIQMHNNICARNFHTEILVLVFLS